MRVIDLIGKKLKRISFLLKKDDDYHLVFSVIEEILPDMQDFQDFQKSEFKIFRANHSKNGSNDKIYLTIDYFELTEDFFSNPPENYVITNNDGIKTQILCEGDYKISPKPKECQWILPPQETFDILPQRPYSKALKVYTDRSKKIQREITTDKDFSRQVSELSTEEYGTDLLNFPELLGNIYIISYNPYFRSVDWTMSRNPYGVYAHFLTRNQNGFLNVGFSNKNNEGFTEFYRSFKIDLKQHHYFFDLPDEPDNFNIHIWDETNNLVYVYDNMRFIKSIAFNMNILSSQLRLTHRDGGKDTVDKHINESFTVGEKSQKDNILSSTSQAFSLLEQSLDFAFFDGSTDEFKRTENKNRAANFLKKIIARASQSCIIADPYFNLDDLSHYIYTMPQSGVVVRILGSTEFLSSKHDEKKNWESKHLEAKEIVKSLNSYKEKTGIENIIFRLLKGKCPLHDRYVVVDDKIWLIGTSFNEIGNRACTIIKLPKESSRKLITHLESWFSDDTKSISIEEYASESNPNQQ